MKHSILQGCGVALFVLGAQGAVRQLVHHHDTGLLGWLPGGFAATLTVHLLAVVIGAALASHREKSLDTGPSMSENVSDSSDPDK
jgi:hypothetical protein